jgi:hypothetical protein
VVGGGGVGWGGGGGGGGSSPCSPPLVSAPAGDSTQLWKEEVAGDPISFPDWVWLPAWAN